MVDKYDYTQEMTEAACSVMLELVRLLGEYADDMRIIGGWVPELLVSRDHIGSIDVDIVLNHLTISEECYSTIEELLLSRGYERGAHPYMFLRKVKIGDREIVVHVDFLAGETGGTTKGHRHQVVQGLKARKARGADLAFEMYKEVTLTGTLPGGGKDSATVRVASIVPFFVMKAMAMRGRLKEKDAYDIYFCLKRYPTGISSIIEEFRPHLRNKLVQEGLEIMREKFSSIDSIGPVQIANFEAIMDLGERDIIQRDAFGQVEYFLEQLGFTLQEQEL
jgi:hypothetical protein